jgi:4-diphosphocytidyl-2-C-methyl-D-erythritol kinase
VAAVPDAIRIFAPAKINLYLHIGARRDDGYHELESLIAFADVGDELLIAPASELWLGVEGPFAPALAGEADNLVLRTARALAAEARIEPRAHLTLVKNLPVASGIGGGSADAAAALRGLSQFWNLSVADEALQRIAVSLGADVPACLRGGALRVAGIGDRLTSLAGLPVLDAVLVNPGVPVSTAEVFKRLETRSGTLPRVLPSDWSLLIGALEKATNDLEKPAVTLAPEIREVINVLCDDPLSLLARMSGSGATCFGIYGDADAAQTAAHTIAKKYPKWWVRAVKLNSPSP